MKCLITHKHTLKILFKSKHLPLRYKRKREWVFFLSEHQTKIPTRIFFYISVEYVLISTKFSRYVCEELGIPSKSKFNINCIQIFIVYCGSVKRIIHKHVNMMSELRHHHHHHDAKRSAGASRRCDRSPKRSVLRYSSRASLIHRCHGKSGGPRW